jgi:hypothetical protein
MQLASEVMQLFLFCISSNQSNKTRCVAATRLFLFKHQKQDAAVPIGKRLGGPQSRPGLSGVSPVGRYADRAFRVLDPELSLLRRKCATSTVKQSGCYVLGIGLR